MYSLYRAWLSLGTPPPAAPPLSFGNHNNTVTSGSPDVTIQVGPAMTQFSAHRNVLTLHSGYFKAALINNHDSTALGPIIIVPNINVDEFSTLLTFMYTGYLDLNLGNIYNVLLASHILHMPNASDLCRAYLIRNSQHAQHSAVPSTPSTLSASIPSTLSASIPSTLSASIPSTNIIKPIANRRATIVQGAANQKQRSIMILPPTAAANFHQSDATLFKSIRKITTPPTVMEPSTSTKASDCKKNKSHNPKRTSNHSNATDDTKIVVDVACCDGPVRFHRVLNKNYGNDDKNATEAKHESTSLNIPPTNRTAALNKIMNENIQRCQQKDDENNTSNSTANALFTCLYCNHTFKSQYCYQKHARRHLNPVAMPTTAVTTATLTTTASVSTVTSTCSTMEQDKREVKLLDMNVQYYPCKTCGSKFPSYYFVHKHRKLCHGDELSITPTNVNEEAATSTTDKMQEDTTSDSSAIDVEAINDL